MNDLKSHRLIYLATPYSKYPYGIDAAFIDAAELAARMADQGLKVVAPIVLTHPMAEYGDLDPYDHAFWMEFDEPLMEAADALVVAELPGWVKSAGITTEIKVFMAQKKPIYHLDPVTLEVWRRNG